MFCHWKKVLICTTKAMNIFEYINFSSTYYL
nr:MAG TPA: hypothetical protein [Caudoviricetes sp.]